MLRDFTLQTIIGDLLPDDEMRAFVRESPYDRIEPYESRHTIDLQYNFFRNGRLCIRWDVRFNEVYFEASNFYVSRDYFMREFNVRNNSEHHQQQSRKLIDLDTHQAIMRILMVWGRWGLCDT